MVQSHDMRARRTGTASKSLGSVLTIGDQADAAVNERLLSGISIPPWRGDEFFDPAEALNGSLAPTMPLRVRRHGGLNPAPQVDPSERKNATARSTTSGW